MTAKLTAAERRRLQIKSRQYHAALDGWGGDRKSADWRTKLAKKRGTKAARAAAMAAQAPLDPSSHSGRPPGIITPHGFVPDTWPAHVKSCPYVNCRECDRPQDCPAWRGKLDTARDLVRPG